MKEFKTESCNVQFSIEDLQYHDINKEDSTVQTVQSKSELFRQLYDAGMEICEIAKETGSHYSFVYGVISNSRDVRTVQRTSKAAVIRRLHDQGLRPCQIAKEVSTHSSYVHNVLSKYKKQKEVKDNA